MDLDHCDSLGAYQDLDRIALLCDFGQTDLSMPPLECECHSL